MQDLRITTIQTKLIWEDVEANLTAFSNKIEGLRGQTDLVILPEMFTTGFSMQPERSAEVMGGKTMAWMAQKAAYLQAVITGSLIIQENNQYYNRLIWMRPDGTFSTYNKRHLFTLAGEHEHYAAGSTHLLAEWKGWKICPLICYDLRFPVWSRNVHNYDLLLYVANWPITRSHHWKTLLTARAIENQSYTIGVNRVGKDANDLHYSGDTSVFDFAGNTLYQVSNREAVSTLHLSHREQESFRSRLNFLPDRDSFSIE